MTNEIFMGLLSQSQGKTNKLAFIYRFIITFYRADKSFKSICEFIGLKPYKGWTLGIKGNKEIREYIENEHKYFLMIFSEMLNFGFTEDDCFRGALSAMHEVCSKELTPEQAKKADEFISLAIANVIIMEDYKFIGYKESFGIFDKGTEVN